MQGFRVDEFQNGALFDLPKDGLSGQIPYPPLGSSSLLLSMSDWHALDLNYISSLD